MSLIKTPRLYQYTEQRERERERDRDRDRETERQRERERGEMKTKHFLKGGHIFGGILAFQQIVMN